MQNQCDIRVQSSHKPNIRTANLLVSYCSSLPFFPQMTSCISTSCVRPRASDTDEEQRSKQGAESLLLFLLQTRVVHTPSLEALRFLRCGQSPRREGALQTHLCGGPRTRLGSCFWFNKGNSTLDDPLSCVFCELGGRLVTVQRILLSAFTASVMLVCAIRGVAQFTWPVYLELTNTLWVCHWDLLVFMRGCTLIKMNHYCTHTQRFFNLRLVIGRAAAADLWRVLCHTETIWLRSGSHGDIQD